MFFIGYVSEVSSLGGQSNNVRRDDLTGRNRVIKKNMKKKFFAGLAVGIMLFGMAGAASATTMTNNLNDVVAAGGISVAIPGAEYSTITSIADPFGGTIGLSSSMTHYKVGSSWSTWASTYGDPSGLDILYSNSANSVTFTFAPDLVEDFGFELEPNPFSVINFTLGLSDGSTLSQDVNGSAGALAFGFTGGDVSWLTISGGSDFAVGRLKMDTAPPVPEPATILLMGTGLAGLLGARRKKKT